MNSQESPKYRCLLVDDNYEFAKMLQDALASEYLVVYAQDAFTAQQHLSQTKFDIILSDICMPFLDGLDFAKVLRKRLIHIPLIFITGEVTAEVSQKALELGAANILQKPFRLQDLKQKIETALELWSHADMAHEEDHEIGYVYNLLKAHYYDIQEIFYQIQYYQVPLSVVKSELDKKERIGRCHLDDPANIKFLGNLAS